MKTTMSKSSEQKTPGSLVKQFVDQYALSPATVAENCGMSTSAVRQLLQDKIRISPKCALYLSKYFGTTPEKWLVQQNAFDLEQLRKDPATMKFYDGIKHAEKVKVSAAKRSAAADKPAAKRGKAAAKPGRKPAGTAKKPATGAKRGRKPKTLAASAASSPFSDFEPGEGQG